MNRRIFILIGVYVAVILLFAWLRPEKMDWSPSFSPDRTIPFGTKVLFNELNSIRPETIERSVRPVYNTLGEMTRPDSTIYFFLNAQFEPAPLDIETLLEFVAQGNTAFIASTSITSALLDTLHIRQEYEYIGSVNATEWFYEDNIDLTLTSKSEQEWPAAVASGYNWFILEDSTHTILGHVDQQHPIFVRCPFGEGQIYLHAFPYVFSNYHMLYQENHSYVSSVIGEVSPSAVWLWDTYYLNATGGRAQSPLAALNRYESFRWAYWLSILVVLIFIVFTAKRRQRVIPVIEPRRNTTLDFVQTIGDLYYHRSDHADLINKKIRILQAQLLKKYRVLIKDFSEEEAQEIAIRSGLQVGKVSPLFAFVRQLISHPESQSETVFKLQASLDQFLQRSLENGKR